jgi:CBS domain containing-hemolysin-like protein
MPTVGQTADRQEVIRQASRRGQSVVGVLDASEQHLVGCYLVADVLISSADNMPLLPVVPTAGTESSISVLMRLQTSPAPIATIEDASGRTLGIVEKERLMSLLLPSN